ncbi:MAG: hypothetical protein AB8G77_10310 [Rhodothermales bacterium]
MSVVDFIIESAKIPSFSTFEERLHPYLYEILNECNDVNIVHIKDNNVLVEIGLKQGVKPVVVTSHLDKINHFGKDYPEVLNVEVKEGEIVGQMDDTAGIGICLNLIKKAQDNDFPPLVVLFSEMEESTGLKHHPHLLKNNGKDVGPQIGAKRLCEYIDTQNLDPVAFITIDTTPIFKGESGVALYTEHWEKTGFMPDSTLRGKIEKIKSFVLSCDSEVTLANGTNDYMVYGEYFGRPEKGNVPSIAIEPAIYPYHQIGEGVFIEDIMRIESILEKLLLNFNFSEL